MSELKLLVEQITSSRQKRATATASALGIYKLLKERGPMTTLEISLATGRKKPTIHYHLTQHRGMFVASNVQQARESGNVAVVWDAV